MASVAIEKLAEKADRAVLTLRGVRAKAKINEARMVHFLEGGAGAVAAGAADAYFDEPELFGLPAVPIITGLTAVLGLLEIIPGGEHMAAIGGGGLHYALGAMTFKKVNEYEAK